jgi:hypothetical protein
MQAFGRSQISLLENVSMREAPISSNPKLETWLFFAINPGKPAFVPNRQPVNPVEDPAGRGTCERLPLNFKETGYNTQPD